MPTSKTSILSLFFFLSCSLFTQAQIGHGGTPRGRELPQHVWPKAEEVNYFENETDELPKTKKELIIGNALEVNYAPDNSGKWYKFADGDLWLIRIRSGNAQGVGLFLSEFELTAGAVVFVYATDNDHFVGSFTSENNSPLNCLLIQSLLGDDIILELWQPKYTKTSNIRIAEVNHMFKKTDSDSSKKGVSQPCNININCPEGDHWQVEKRSVVRLEIGRRNGTTESCTGTLINSASETETPYMLTAKHCISDDYEAKRTLCFFNDESLNCTSHERNKGETMSGVFLRATGFETRLDFSLVEFTKVPKPSYNYTYAGWDRTGTNSKGATAIHHPNGDAKKISATYDDLFDFDLDHVHYIEDKDSMWGILWALGSTEGGSSGGPLFNTRHEVIGALAGGLASCSLTYETDGFTKFHVAWDRYASKGDDFALKPWLDPHNTGVTHLCGYDPARGRKEEVKKRIANKFLTIRTVTQNSIQIELTLGSIANVRLYDMSGKMHGKWMKLEGVNTLTFPQLASGVYLLHARSDREQYHEKIIIRR